MAKYITPEGLKKIKKDLSYLKDVKRKEIIQRLEEASALGDLSENSEFQEAKEAQSFLEGRILELEERAAQVVVVSGIKSSFAQIGSIILTSSPSGKESFKIVGLEEANPLEGKISAESPLGKALLNQQKGTDIVVDTPRGKMRYRILKIE